LSTEESLELEGDRRRRQSRPDLRSRSLPREDFSRSAKRT
jgi:hypothetical protein